MIFFEQFYLITRIFWQIYCIKSILLWAKDSLFSLTFDSLNHRAIARNPIGYHCSFWLNEHCGAEFRWYTALSWRANYRLRSNDVLTAKFNRLKWRILYRTLTFNKLADNSTDTGIVPLESAWPLLASFRGFVQRPGFTALRFMCLVREWESRAEDCV